MKRLVLLNFMSLSAITLFAQEQADTLSSVGIQHGTFINGIKAYKNKQQLIVDAKTIENSSATTVDQALRNIAGVDIRQRGAAGVQTDIAIDGGTFDQTMLLVNGLKISDPQTGHNMMMLPFELQNTGQLQIIKGAASGLYGVNALTGVIDVITKDVEHNHLDVTLNGGSSFEKNRTENLYYNSGVVLQGGIKTNNFKHNFNAGWKNSNGYRANTAYKSPNLWYDTKGSIGKNQLHLMGGYRYMDFGANGFYAAPGDSTSHETVQNTVLGIKHLLPFSNKLTWMNDVVYNYKTDDYKYIKEPVLGHNKHFQNIVNVTTALRYASAWGNVRLGLEFRNEQLNSSNLGERARSNMGVLLNYDKILAEKLSIEAGAYANQNSNFGFQVYPSLGLGYFLGNYSKLVVNISSGQRLPTFTDLYYNQRGVIEGNPNLRPEQAINADIGYQAQWSHLQVNSYVFYRSISQFIDWTKQDLSDVWHPENYQQMNTYGFHFSANYSHTVNEDITMGYYLGYNFLEPSLEQQEGSTISRYAINSLRHHAALNVYTRLWGAVKIQLGANYQSRISYKDYWLLNTSAAYNLKQWEVGINVQNLNDVTVVEAGAQPLPGRWMQVFLKYSIR